jgi:hypothetical protein
MAQPAPKSDYQGKLHNLQKDMIGRYYDSLTASAYLRLNRLRDFDFKSWNLARFCVPFSSLSAGPNQWCRSAL